MALQQELHFRLIFSCIVASTISTLALFSAACVENIRFTYPWRYAMGGLFSRAFMCLLLQCTNCFCNRNFVLCQNIGCVPICCGTISRYLCQVPLWQLHIEPTHSLLDIVWLFYGLSILCDCGFHLQFSWGCAVSILKWQLSKPLIAPLNSIVDPTDSEQNVLTKPASPLKQHLVLQRLADLVAIDATARATVFSLNTLGGRPMLWRHISGWCTTALEQFVSNVQLANGHIMQKTVNAAISSSEVMFQCHLPASFRTQLRPKNAFNSIINPMVTEGPPVFVGSLLDLIAQGDYKGLAKTIYVKITKALSSLPMLQSLDSDLAYATTAQLFTGPTLGGSTGLPAYGSGQSIIWAVEILACLTLASYTEDTYGCVQRSLGRILTLFVDTLEAVEQHLRLVGLLTKEVGPTSTYAKTHHYDVSQDSSLSADADSSISLHPYIAHSTTLRTEDVCNLTYYRFSSDPSLPWRTYATLTWAVTNCLKQFGDHLDSIQLNQKAKQKLKVIMSTRIIMDQVNGSVKS
ncbi:hypothetical protein EG68_09981 [Paragonimus skrjabini miyazakii]|uniref:Nucleoporin NDC1 n=1 Tax=Paragonimus skrjabini miyazakii TaxID=59628 RepID=A0A8S9YT88_9TREM|nr:hypothetical protein EG68_09981 [Paragonimus skrjabini miyazakii]